MTEEKPCNDPTCKKTREGIQHKYHGREIMPRRIWLKRELASSMGITICGKCGTRTKMKHTESIPDKIGKEWIGHAICPKCGNKEKWLSGDVGSGGSA